jgi:carbamoyltransferase
MTVWTLGISAFYHDAAAAIVRDGEVVAAAQEERFSRIKHDPSFPIGAITYCLEAAGIDPQRLDAVVYYEKPLRTFERMLRSFEVSGVDGGWSWLKAMPKWTGEKLHIGQIIADTLGIDDEKILFVPHHLSHAAAAYYPSPYDEAAILTIDGVGEWATATIGVGVGDRIELIREMDFPDSLGLLYSAFTHFTGFKINSGEYKMMGLAPYGRPRYLDAIHKIATVNDDGSVRLDQSYFAYTGGDRMVSTRFARLFDGPARKPESRITRREMDIAASIQAFTEEVVLRMAAHAAALTGRRNLCMAGGVALNCVANGHLLRAKTFDDIWIQPAAGDAGSALGAALLAQHGFFGVPRAPAGRFCRQSGSFLGPEFSRAEVRAYLDSYEIPYRELAADGWADAVAQALTDGKIVGFFQGRMEFGPRSLGGRSILGNPMRADTQKQMNLQIKYRESFRPFAPAVLAEDVSDYFDLDRPSPFMLLVAPVSEQRRLPRATDEIDGDDLLAAVSQPRSDIPAVTHWDYSARVQTVHRETNPAFHDLLTAFKRKTGVGVLVNTSFNIRGEPIVCTPDDAYRCFINSEMDYLFVEGFWLDKTAQKRLEQAEMERWRDAFKLD